MAIKHKSSILSLVILCSFFFSTAWGSQAWQNQNVQNNKQGAKSSFLSPHRPFVKSEGQESKITPPPSGDLTNTSKKPGVLKSLKNRFSPLQKTGVGDLNHNQKALEKRATLQLRTLFDLTGLKRTTLVKFAHIHELKILCQQENPGKSDQSCASIAEIMARQKGNRNAAATTKVRESCKGNTPDLCFKDTFNNLNRTFNLMNRRWPDSCNQQVYAEAKIQTGSPDDSFEIKLKKLKAIEHCASSIKGSIPSKK